MNDEKYDVIIVGAGLSGLSCAYELLKKGKKVLILEKKPYAGGRTSSFDDNGMQVESGLHRYIGYYSALPRFLKECRISIENIVTWEEKADILIKNKNKKMVLGLAPFFGFKKTARGILENRDILSAKDKFSLLPFFICGFSNYLFLKDLDKYSVSEYANRHKVTKKAQRLVLEPLSSGIFFLPPENYSAYAFFGLFWPAVYKFYKMRIGAFLGGMTDIMCAPIVEKIKEMGGKTVFGEPIEKVIFEKENPYKKNSGENPKNIRIKGVKAESGQNYYSDFTIIATPLSAAKQILNPLKKVKKLEKVFRLPCMSACTFQLELKKPALKKDITSFGPGTDAVSFAEQSRSTFKNSNGRLSLILGNPKEYCQKSAEEILPVVIKEMQSLGVHLEDNIKDFRKVSEENGFYSLSKGSQKLRPKQNTQIPGLFLAGDYTLTRSFATMEGAVIAGRKAAKECLKNFKTEKRKY